MRAFSSSRLLHLCMPGGKESGLMVTILGERRASPSCLPQTEEPSFVCCVDL